MRTRSLIGPLPLTGADLAGPLLAQIGKSNWGDGYGFPSADRHVYLGPSGEHIYYAGYQLDAKNLGLVLGKSSKVFVENAAATWAVSDKSIIDAKLLTSAAALPGTPRRR